MILLTIREMIIMTDKDLYIKNVVSIFPVHSNKILEKFKN